MFLYPIFHPFFRSDRFEVNRQGPSEIAFGVRVSLQHHKDTFYVMKLNKKKHYMLNASINFWVFK
jgi:hypothetical protein